MKIKAAPDYTESPSKPRLILGGFIFISGFLLPLFIPLVTGSNLSTEWIAVLSGVLLLGLPEVFMVIAITILGKPGFVYLKSHLWKLIRPSETVSLLRYRLGLLLLFVPIVFVWLNPYLEQVLPGLSEVRVILSLLSSALMGLSLFVLGGEFWDKLRSLFFYNMRVVQAADQLDQIQHSTTQTNNAPPTSRMLTGGMFIALSLFLPLFIPLLKHVPINDELRIVVSGLMFFGIPQLLMFLAITILGKAGFAYLKQHMGKLLRGLLDSQVSHNRYRLGVLLLTTPLIVGVTWPYLSSIFDILNSYKYEIAITGDLILVVAVFVLGGEFWEKLIGLFKYQSRIIKI